MFTETAKELPVCPVQNCPSIGVSFFEGGGRRQEGNSIQYCFNGMPKKDTLDSVAYTCML
jgi:hypothetical protein